MFLNHQLMNYLLLLFNLMLMKKYIIFSFCLLFILICSCSKNEPAYIKTIGQSSYSISAKSSSTAISFSTNSAWTAKSSDSWLSVSPSSGNSGDNIAITISAAANPNWDSRSASVTLMADDASQIISITQMQKEGFLLSDNKLFIGSEGGSLDIPVKANVDYNCKVNDNCKDWISISQTKALSEYKITLNILKNETYDKRTGSLEIVFADQSETVSIEQSQYDELIVTNKNYNIGSEGGSISVQFETNCDYSYKLVSETNWISTIDNSSTKALTEYSINFKVSPNETFDCRIAQVLVSAANKESIITITQSPKEELVINEKNFNIGGEGGFVTIPLLTNATCEVHLFDNSQDWISIIDSNTRSLRNDSVILFISENKFPKERTGNVLIKCANKECVVSVTQGRKASVGSLNGHEWVDLGIRKSHIYTNIIPGSSEDKRIVFATKNIGAYNIDDYGYYFRWGEQEGWSISRYNYYQKLSGIQYDKNGNPKDSKFTSYWLRQWNVRIGDVTDFQNKNNLDCNGTIYGDAASYNWGDGWMMMDSNLANLLNVKSIAGMSSKSIGESNNLINLNFRLTDKGYLISNDEFGTSIMIPYAGRVEEDGELLYSYGYDGYYSTSSPLRATLVFNSTGIQLHPGGLCFLLDCAFPIRPIAEIE